MTFSGLYRGHPLHNFVQFLLCTRRLELLYDRIDLRLIFNFHSSLKFAYLRIDFNA